MQSKSPSHANPRAPSRLMAAPLQSRPPEAGALPLRETRGKEAPFPFPPGASRGGESSPPRRQHRSAPPARGFSKRSAENPLARSPCGHDGESVQSETMRAAKQEADVFPLAALCLLAENSHRGHRLSTAVLHQGFAPINSSTATSFQAFLYDEGRRSRSTSKERDAETGLDYFGARYFSSAQGRWTGPDQPFADQHLEDPQSWNMYAYVRNNPLKNIDPDGRQSCAMTPSACPSIMGSASGSPTTKDAAMALGIIAAPAAILAAPEFAAGAMLRGIGSVVLGYMLGHPQETQEAAASVAENISGAPPGSLSPNALGALREEVVAGITGGKLAGDVAGQGMKVTVKGLGSTDVDVIGKAGEYIGVGGPGKANNLADLGRKLQILKAAADDSGTTAKYYFQKGTPENVLNLARKKLGSDNVSTFELPR